MQTATAARYTRLTDPQLEIMKEYLPIQLPDWH